MRPDSISAVIRPASSRSLRSIRWAEAFTSFMRIRSASGMSRIPWIFDKRRVPDIAGHFLAGENSYILIHALLEKSIDENRHGKPF